MNIKNFWLSKNLTEQAAIVLADLGIDTLEDLVGAVVNEQLLHSKINCQEETSREIINFRRKLLPTTNTSNKKVNKRAVEILKHIAVSEIDWDIKTFNLIRESHSQTVYDLAMINLPAYMGLKNYNFHGYHKIKSKIFEILTEINSTFADAHKNENISLRIFVEKPNGTVNNNKDKFIPAEEADAVLDEANFGLVNMAENILRTLTAEEVYVVKLYYGFDYKPKTYQKIADLIDSNREHIRHIKEKANRKVQNIERLRRLYEHIRLLFEPFIMDLLNRYDHKVSVQKIKIEIFLRNSYSHKEMAIFNWLTDIIGDNWICHGSDKYKADSKFCELV